jgi:hypothetical protein
MKASHVIIAVLIWFSILPVSFYAGFYFAVHYGSDMGSLWFNVTLYLLIILGIVVLIKGIKRCPNCRKRVEVGYKRCPYCGSEFRIDKL